MPAADPPKVPLERRQALEQRLRRSPADREGYLELAQIYRAEDRPQEAKRTLEQARQIFPDDLTLLWELEEAILARSLQQLREVSDLAQRLQTPEADYELQRSLGDWARRRIEICRARLARDPSLVHLSLALGEALIDAGDFQAAIEAVAPALAHDEFSCHAHWLIGRCHLATGEDVAALPSLRAASLRRAVPAPPKIRLAALRLLVETAERLGLTLTLERYRQQLRQAEQTLRGTPSSPEPETSNDGAAEDFNAAAAPDPDPPLTATSSDSADPQPSSP